MGEEQKYGKIIFTDSNGEEHEIGELKSITVTNSMSEMKFSGVSKEILSEYEGHFTTKNDKLYYYFKRQLREWKRHWRMISKWNKYRVKRANKLKSDIIC